MAAPLASESGRNEGHDNMIIPIRNANTDGHTSHGHSISRTTVKGGSRVQFGDVHNHFYGHESAQREDAEKLLMAELDFPQFRRREETVADAHAKTFEWVFDDADETDDDGSAVKVEVSRERERVFSFEHVSNFASWLESGHGTYWINGKAASGKSTLMKYIVNHPKLHAHLGKWSQGRMVYPVSFFFWSGGTELQRSHEGLLRSLLLTIFDKERHLVSECFPETIGRSLDRAKALRVAPQVRRPSFDEIKRGFAKLLERKENNFKLCLFIDGLDEYSGDIREMCSILNEMSESKFIKVVLSSRPVPTCIEAFRLCPGLRLQDLTKFDIRTYVEDTLKSHSRMQQREEDDPQAAQALIDEVCNKASGVFLWVILVSKFLLNSLDNFDTTEEMLVALNTYPGELHELYKHMLMKMDKSWRSQASQLLQIVYQRLIIGRRTLPTLQLYFDSLDPTKIIATKVQAMSSTEKHSKCEEMEGRVRSRCCGLVEIVNPSERRGFYASLKGLARSALSNSRDWNLVDSQVQFLHKTVVDFLKEPEIRSFILSLCDNPDFEVNTNVVAGSIAHLKALPQEKKIDDRSKIWVLMQDAIFYASQAEDDLKRPITRYIDELDKTMLLHWRAASQWSGIIDLDSNNDGYYQYHPDMKSALHWNDILGHWSVAVGYAGRTASHEESFLSLVVAYDLVLYTNDVLKASSSVTKGTEGQQLLKQTVRAFAFRPSHNFQKKEDLINCFFSHSIPADGISETAESPWACLLSYLASKFNSWGADDIDRWTRIIQLFLDSGIDVNEPIEAFGEKMTLLAFLQSRSVHKNSSVQTVQIDLDPVQVRAECQHVPCVGYDYCREPGHSPQDTNIAWNKLCKMVENRGGISQVFRNERRQSRTVIEYQPSRLAMNGAEVTNHSNLQEVTEAPELSKSGTAKRDVQTFEPVAWDRKPSEPKASRLTSPSPPSNQMLSPDYPRRGRSEASRSPSRERNNEPKGGGSFAKVLGKIRRSRS